MKIAIIGIRGVPATYSGLETEAEEIGSRLVARGHEVTVYCRSHSVKGPATTYKGIKRIILPSLNTKITDTYSHSFVCMIHVLSQKPDVILAFNPAISTLCVLPKLFGYRVALNPDGFDWQRKKWGKFARFFIYASAWACTKIVDQMIIDAISVQRYFNEAFNCNPSAVYIPNGGNLETSEMSNVSEEETARILGIYGLEKERYILFLSRHEPENSCEYIIDAFKKLDTDMKLFFGGGVTYKSAYAESLRNIKDPRIIFPGGIYDPIHVKVLHHNCYFLVNGNQPGGTSLGLLKSLGYGTCTLVVDTPDNAYVIKDAGMVFNLSVQSLHEKMRFLIDNYDEVKEFRRKAIKRTKEEYLWDVVTDKYEETLLRLIGEKGKSIPHYNTTYDGR